MDWCVELVPYGEDAVALLPDELLAVTGWAVGDELEWEVRDGVLLLKSQTAEETRDL